MAKTIQINDPIDSSGYPLGFKVRQGTQRPGVLGAAPARDVFRVEARALGGHQKEAVVREGETGSAWRMVSDEGASLRGSDLAPFPLGFMCAGLQADLQNRIVALAQARRIGIDRLETALESVYRFEGSFFRGDGRGSAASPLFRVNLGSPASAADIRSLIAAALDASPAIAALRAALQNTFALYTNGQRRPLQQLRASVAAEVADPLKVWKQKPAPLASTSDLPDLISKVGEAPQPQSGAAPAGAPSDSIRFEIHIHGASHISDGRTRSETWAARRAGSRFALKSDERTANDQAPSGLAILSAGVAFCLMTQLLRYTEHHKMNVRAIRVVQLSPFELAVAPPDSLQAVAHPFDTHVFVHGEESDETMEKLLKMAANTCYLHASLHTALDPRVAIELNGAPLSDRSGAG